MSAYESALAQLRGRERRKVGNNTYLGIDPFTKSIALRYHSTDVMTWLPDGSIVLDTDGWHTPTTKVRIDHWLPSGLRLMTDSDGAWAVYRLRAKRPASVESWGFGWDGRRYFDGMRINEDGEVLNPQDRSPYSAARTESGW